MLHRTWLRALTCTLALALILAALAGAPRVSVQSEGPGLTAPGIVGFTAHFAADTRNAAEPNAAADPLNSEVLPSASHATTVTLPLVLRDFSPPSFTASKRASPTKALVQDPGALIAYTAEFTNTGTAPGTLSEIEDTLPTGFTFVTMLPGSDVIAAPIGTTGRIVWTGPFDVAGGEPLTVLYQVRAATTAGTYVNSATASASVGAPPAARASASVELVPPILLEDSFDSNADLWTLFLNQPNKLNPAQWYWSDGSYDHDRRLGSPGPSDDALTMYLQPGSEQWTDYRFEADVWMDPGTTFASLWFRGHYQDSASAGQWVLGYYFTIHPGGGSVSIWQTQTELDCLDDTCTTPRWQYNFSNPMSLLSVDRDLIGFRGAWQHIAVEVRGPNMKGFINGEQVIDFTDAVGTIILNGTVGLATYHAPLIRFDNVKVTALY